jgi:hypothetical protein
VGSLPVGQAPLFLRHGKRYGGAHQQGGWYANGRVVVSADKTDLTGWGAGIASFHSKYRGFVGLALFTSEDPSRLPWTTSKRGLNREALIYQLAWNRMTSVARPVISFLNDMYPSDPVENSPERVIAERIVQKDFRSALQSPPKASQAALPTCPKEDGARAIRRFPYRVGKDSQEAPKVQPLGVSNRQMDL